MAYEDLTDQFYYIFAFFLKASYPILCNCMDKQTVLIIIIIIIINFYGCVPEKKIILVWTRSK